MAGTAEAAVWALAGILLASGGLAWAVWAAVCLRAAGNSLRPGQPPRVLVDHGPYRFSRHPMYLGGTLSLFGLALALAQPLLAALAFLTGLGLRMAVLPAEEAQLRRRFGAWYSDYMVDVRSGL